jgi:hypothetical protein
MKEIDENALENALAGQIPEAPQTQVETQVSQDPPKISHVPGQRKQFSDEEMNEFYEKSGATRVGGNIFENAEIREGWVSVDKSLLGERAQFYPENWEFKIKPATVEAIRNWSMINDENPNSIDDVFNEILKTCLAITTPQGPMPWSLIRSWDRFWFILLIREYTFIHGEREVRFTEECPECGDDVEFKLTSQSLMYDMPDESVMKHYLQEEQTWLIDPQEYDVNWNETVTLYLPTLDKDANLKAWLIDRIQNKKKVDQVYLKFITWLAPKISKDLTIAQRQIREYENIIKSWNTDMFSFMDEVITNIMVTPASSLIATCPKCGEEVTAQVRFPNGVRDLFNVSSGRKKFGNK